jgi:hypothetical protein
VYYCRTFLRRKGKNFLYIGKGINEALKRWLSIAFLQHQTAIAFCAGF